VDRFATDMVPQKDLEQVSSYLDRRGIPGITDENVQLQQYEAELLKQMRKEKALADKKEVVTENKPTYGFYADQIKNLKIP